MHVASTCCASSPSWKYSKAWPQPGHSRLMTVTTACAAWPAAAIHTCRLPHPPRINVEGHAPDHVPHPRAAPPTNAECGA
eukprot:350821-Chlamydomonas_euryale.AAC.1